MNDLHVCPVNVFAKHAQTHAVRQVRYDHVACSLSQVDAFYDVECAVAPIEGATVVVDGQTGRTGHVCLDEDLAVRAVQSGAFDAGGRPCVYPVQVTTKGNILSAAKTGVRWRYCTVATSIDNKNNLIHKAQLH